MRLLVLAVGASALAALRVAGAGVAGSPPADELARGQVMAKVVCRADATQSYALYLPTTYDPARPWPILYCFDPGGRGRVPVELFRGAAEEFGYVVAGSNNARNGPWEDSLRAIDALLRDAGARLSLDARRSYTAGFSGGARAASAVAVAGLVRGVIACSGAFAGGETPRKVPFVFFGTAGVDDFNLPEMLRTDGELDARNSPHRVVFFAGGHDWPPPEVAREAVEWLELQAMRAGTRPRDAAFVQGLLDRRLSAAAALPPPEAWREYQSLARDFQGLADTADAARRAEELGRSREVRAWLKEQRALEQRQIDRQDELERYSRQDEFSWLRDTVDALRKQAAAPADSPDRRLARRVMAGAGITALEQARLEETQRNYGEAVRHMELAALLQPENPGAHYRLARVRALHGERGPALEALRAAVAAGFKDAARLEQDAAFVGLRRQPAYQEILAGLRR